ncbi:pilus assembly protein [Arthrobacter sp. TPD3018]|uniref:TadE/TadG family type IV pilus assembly protein n=1 Tax=Bacteria TaxID=2 RepID=UPI000D51504B|nr:MULTISPECIES: TadE/TadG family type IV pilus assembly protein [Bacteria]PVE53472.1 pilus assembly protein [Sphingomonas sp. TPD3009]PVE56089.1 pilus assembly protein [Arthrobacter sp. TPD3018]PVE81689.1 pilus assembly protein [Sphingomonas melonis]
MIARLRRWRDLARDTRGVALIEFAMVLPILLILYLGSVQLQDGIACKRKVTIATRATADLIAQNASGSTTKSDVDNSLAAATQVMAPYRSDRAVIRLTHITIDNMMRVRIDWSRARNGLPETPGTLSNIPLAMRVPGVSFIVAHVTYNYRPPANFGFVKPIALDDFLVMLPRNSQTITCSDCNT